MAFKTVYRKDTGEKVLVPESHLRIFPGVFVLSRPGRKSATGSPTEAASAVTEPTAPANGEKEKK